jgi:arsenate reductase (thioredoxin)
MITPDSAPGSKPSVLFMCVHNAGRSQMAAGYLRALAGDRIDVRSAGSSPGQAINPVAVEAMAEEGIDITGNRPQHATPDLMQGSDVVVTMGCGDECIYYPGKKYMDWELDDPAGQDLDIVRHIRDDIKHRVEALIAELLKAAEPA